MIVLSFFFAVFAVAVLPTSCDTAVASSSTNTLTTPSRGTLTYVYNVSYPMSGSLLIPKFGTAPEHAGKVLIDVNIAWVSEQDRYFAIEATHPTSGSSDVAHAYCDFGFSESAVLLPWSGCSGIFANQSDYDDYDVTLRVPYDGTKDYGGSSGRTILVHNGVANPFTGNKSYDSSCGYWSNFIGSTGNWEIYVNSQDSAADIDYWMAPVGVDPYGSCYGEADGSCQFTVTYNYI